MEWLKTKVAAVAGVIRDQRIAKSKAHNTTFASSFNVSKQTTGVGSANTAASSSSAGENNASLFIQSSIKKHSVYVCLFVFICVYFSVCLRIYLNFADEPTREDLITALEIVSDYLTPSCTEKLLKAHNMDSSALSASKSAAAAAVP